MGFGIGFLADHKVMEEGCLYTVRCELLISVSFYHYSCFVRKEETRTGFRSQLNVLRVYIWSAVYKSVNRYV